MIRAISGILAAIGIGWALSAYMGLVIPFIALACVILGEEIGAEGGILLLVSFQVYFGYFIWIGWAFRAANKPYLIPRRALWIISAVHHYIWIAIFAVGSYPDNFNLFANLLFCYLGAAALVSTIFVVIDTNVRNAEHQQHAGDGEPEPVST